MKTAKAAVICLALILAAVTALLAKGNEAKGKYYFIQNCKNCHVKGAAGGEVSPLSKSMDQWRKYFASGKHARSKETLVKFVPTEQLVDVQTFLVNHAADSLQPETCGK